MRETFDCQACGACCVAPYDQTAFCDLTAADYKRLTPHERRHVETPCAFDQILGEPVALKTRWRTTKAGLFKGVDVCACVFLRGSIFNRVSCRIYDRRPRSCRAAIKPGDRACRELRQSFHGLA